MRTTSRLAVAVLAGVLPVAAPAAEVALLKSTEVPAWRPTIEAFKKGAAGHTISEFDLRGDRATAEQVLGGLKGKAVILVALGSFAAQTAREVAPDLPLAYAMVPDPAKVGLTPVAGVTGVSASIPVRNQLAAFRMVNPRGVRIGVVYTEAAAVQVAEAEKAQGVLRIQLVTRPVAGEKDVPGALRSLLGGDAPVDAVWMPLDPPLLGEETRRFILSECLKGGKAVYGFGAQLVQEGALAANGPDFTSTGDQLADLVGRLAGGEKARIELLIPRAELVINKKIGDKLKIDIPPDALKAANRVF